VCHLAGDRCDGHPTGHRVILIGLLIAGPCCALLSARWIRSAQAGVIAVGLAIALAIPDGIWGTSAQFAFVGAVLMVALVCTWAAAIIEAVTRSDTALQGEATTS